MSREILFRGKRVDGKGWVEGFLFWMADIAYILPIGSVSPLQNISVIPETIGQFTGICDKNGVKIFEGDKVQVVGGSCKDYVVEYRFASFWQISEFGFSTILDDHDVSYLVTGNIHDK